MLIPAVPADRYFGSFPKVGIVIPNIGQWLLPELQDIAKTLQTTLQLPPDATIGHGFTLEPSSDGLLITFPTGMLLPDSHFTNTLTVGMRQFCEKHGKIWTTKWEYSE